MQTFRLWTAHVKFYQIFTLIACEILAKKCRGVMSHDPEDWCKIWRKTDLLFKKWQEFGGFWPEHSKVSKICIFIGSFCGKYLLFDLKKYRGVIFHDTEEWCKTWRKTDLGFGKFWKMAWGICQIFTRALEVSKLGLWWDPLTPSKFTDELWAMTMKNEAKFEEELTWHFKIGMGNLTNFDLGT